jgi:hypothetical protein
MILTKEIHLRILESLTTLQPINKIFVKYGRYPVLHTTVRGFIRKGFKISCPAHNSERLFTDGM